MISFIFNIVALNICHRVIITLNSQLSTLKAQLSTSQKEEPKYDIRSLDIHSSVRSGDSRHHADSIDGQPPACQDHSLGPGVAVCARCWYCVVHLLRSEHAQDETYIRALARPIVKAFDARICRTAQFANARILLLTRPTVYQSEPVATL